MAQLSPFELARLERIAANKAKLAELGMEQLKADMAKTNAAFAANRQSGTHKPRTSCPAGPRRTSNRVQVRGPVTRSPRAPVGPTTRSHP